MSWAVFSLWSPSTCQPSSTGGKPGVKRGTLWKVRHDGTALNSQRLFSRLSQGTACATVAPVSAGTDGLGTLVKSGWGPSTEKWSRMRWRGRGGGGREAGGGEGTGCLEQPHQQMILPCIMILHSLSFLYWVQMYKCLCMELNVDNAKQILFVFRKMLLLCLHILVHRMQETLTCGTLCLLRSRFVTTSLKKSTFSHVFTASCKNPGSPSLN